MTTQLPFYETDYLRHDLLLGTLHNRNGTKLCYMAGELLFGIQKALEDETGPAWRLILKRCGRIWGRRVAQRFAAETSQFYNRPLNDLPMEEFVALLEGQFRYHGWGLLKLDFTHAEKGIIQASLRNSAFVESVGASATPIDSLVSGLLSELFQEVSERKDLECYETECTAQGKDVCRFVIGTEGRVGIVPELIEQGWSHDQVVRHLCS